MYWEVVSGLLLYCGVWRCIGRWLVAYCCTVGCGGVLGGG